MFSILDYFFSHPINDDMLGFCCVITNYFNLMDVDFVFFPIDTFLGGGTPAL